MTVLGCIAETARTDLARLAISDGSGDLSYGELWARSGRLARSLQRLGVSRGDLVALCARRSAALVVGALGIMRAGGGYVAIDPAYPDERIRWMLEDAAVTASVVDPENAHRLTTGGAAAPPAAPIAVLGRPGDDDAAVSGAEPALTDTAYVVYTSGSTGQPKGVVVAHESLLNLSDWHRDAFAVTAQDHCSQVASPGFDAAMWEIWPTLSAGASLHIADDELRVDPPALRDWLLEREITVSFLPTALAEAVLALSWPAQAPLRLLLTGGDALSRRPDPGFPATLVNNYGLSETTVVATSGVVSPKGDSVPSIGRAIRGVTLEVVDEGLSPVAPGEAGELVVSGVAVAQGYLHRSELTAQRFLDEEDRRRYRTGDRVRITVEGEIEFLGRLDDQLSVRGFRVEPGEIVAALTAHPEVAAATVSTAGESSAERWLVAHLVGAGDGQPSDAELSALVATSLPDYMVPSRYVWLAELPVTEHGKVDREALARLAVTDTTIDEVARAVSGSGEVEAVVSEMLCELLGVDEVGPEENFFLRGGHSMLGAQLIARLDGRFGVEVGLRFLFDHPTVRQIAQEVEALLGQPAVEGMAV